MTVFSPIKTSLAEMGLADQALKSERFRELRMAQWSELEELLNRMDKRGIRSLDTQEILNLPKLYRGALSCLLYTSDAADE